MGVKLQADGGQLNVGNRSKNGPKIKRPKERPKIKKTTNNLFVAHHVNTEHKNDSEIFNSNGIQ